MPPKGFNCKQCGNCCLNLYDAFSTSATEDIKLLKRDRAHTEKAHEALVVSFYEALGYKKFADIKYQLSKIDIAIQDKKKTLIVNEVKRSWNLFNKIESAREQAYKYAL